MKYMTVLEAARKWGISDRRVRFLCAQGRIRGMVQQGRRYLIPDTTEKPRDERNKSRVKDLRKYNDFTRLDFLKKMMNDVPALSAEREKVQEEAFLHRFTCGSAAMEGSTLDQSEIDAVLSGDVVPGHPLAEHMAAVGCLDGMSYGMACARERKSLSQNVIRNIHSLILLNQPLCKGKYRKVQVRLHDDATSALYLDLVEPQMNDLLNVNMQRKKVMHPIERISRFYLEYQAIHPFDDGNGRSARVLLNLELIQNGYLPIVFNKDDLKAHEKAMRQFLEKNDASAMIRLISRKAENEMEHYLSSFQARPSKKGMTTPKPATEVVSPAVCA